MKKSIRTLLTVLLALVFLFSIIRFWQQRQEKASGSMIYKDARALAASPNTSVTQPETTPAKETSAPAEEPRWVVSPPEEEDPHIQTLAQINLKALQKANPDVIGWIMIPDTAIDYPIMQGTDNDYYLKHTWDANPCAVGSIFMEYLCSSDFADFNTIVYGHNMNDGSMFSGLRKYRDPEYWEDHPYVYIRTDLGVYRYQIFSSYLAKVDSSTYGVQITTEESRRRFLDHAVLNSVIDTGVEPQTTDRVLTLSTCSGSGYATRWVVHARLKMILEQPNGTDVYLSS